MTSNYTDRNEKRKERNRDCLKSGAIRKSGAVPAPEGVPNRAISPFMDLSAPVSQREET